MTTTDVRLNRREQAERAAVCNANAAAERCALFRWYKQHNASVRKRRRAFKSAR